MAHVNDKQVAPDAFGYDILQQSRLRYEHGNGVALLMPKCSVSGGRRFAFFAGPVPTCKGNSLVQRFGNVIFPIKARQTYAHQFRRRVSSFDTHSLTTESLFCSITSCTRLGLAACWCGRRVASPALILSISSSIGVGLIK